MYSVKKHKGKKGRKKKRHKNRHRNMLQIVTSEIFCTDKHLVKISLKPVK